MRSGAFKRRGSERRERRRAVLVERRSGFERRRSHGVSPFAAAIEQPLLRLRDDPRQFAQLLVLINLLSVLDLSLTLLVLRLGASELNPLMAYLLELGPATAATFKVSIVGAATVGLWLLRRYRSALAAAVVLLAVYGALVLFELAGLAHLS